MRFYKGSVININGKTIKVEDEQELQREIKSIIMQDKIKYENE